jgi:YHS domain-containing protein
MLRLIFAFSAAALAVCCPLHAADLAAAKCPVSGEAVSKDASIDYKGGKLYFCCNDCAATFASAKDKEKAKYAPKANLQLVVTGQAVQKGCPLSGNKTDASTAIDVGGAKVAFCCNGCKGAVAKLTPAQQIKKIFADEVFDKNFEITKADEKK